MQQREMGWSEPEGHVMLKWTVAMFVVKFELNL